MECEIINKIMIKKDFKDVAHKIFNERYSELFYSIYLQGYLDGMENRITNLFEEKVK